ncbi:hypothetical protein SEA_EDUGATOR_1 [Mycobacterium phage Edugator]|uniref:Gene 1 ring forming protein domain-containing protein n=3 Tax=Kratiovirus larva TaxID=1056831 RepID=A0A221J731_9CAUD|nr:hypothetical protein SEA_ALLEYCAT_1 [Mycobacterium phage AlleyCat]ASR85699.1 hypothetical protein SEA_EDUGATOR_1 [Mycobacterium phage Edugator]QQV92607.1 hypothetical protein SEA_PSYCHO_1 [Mycobacterium phage Psycho]WAB09683.1 hypothetical protein SEA_DADOSKY_1 [Mycobacterium phage Dadosky]
MAQADSGTVTVLVEPDLNHFKESVQRVVTGLQPPVPPRPDSELRLEALQLAVRAHSSGDQDRDATIVETARAFADFIIDGGA